MRKKGRIMGDEGASTASRDEPKCRSVRTVVNATALSQGITHIEKHPRYSPLVPALSNSLIEVLARVFSSTRFTMIAAYKLCEPSAAGKVPDTTTLQIGRAHV